MFVRFLIPHDETGFASLPTGLRRLSVAKRAVAGDQFKNQLKKYIKSGDFEYIFDKQKLINEGISDPEKFVKEQMQNLFKNNAEEIFETLPESLKKELNISDFQTSLTNEQLNKLIDNRIKVE